MAELGVGAASHEARELGQGWKVSPYINIEAGETFTLAEIEGPGCIQHIWMTPTGNWRFYIIRFYWDGETEPSVEVPVGDFFLAMGIEFCSAAANQGCAECRMAAKSNARSRRPRRCSRPRCR